MRVGHTRGKRCRTTPTHLQLQLPCLILHLSLALLQLLDLSGQLLQLAVGICQAAGGVSLLDCNACQHHMSRWLQALLRVSSAWRWLVSW